MGLISRIQQEQTEVTEREDSQENGVRNIQDSDVSAPIFLTPSANSPSALSSPPRETLGKIEDYTLANHRRDVVLAYLRMRQPDPAHPYQSIPSAVKCAAALGVDNVTLGRWVRAYEQATKTGGPDAGYQALLPKTGNSGRKPQYHLPAPILALVRETHARLDVSRERGRAAGSSMNKAFQLVALSGAEEVTEDFRRIVLDLDRRSLPPSWISQVQLPAAVIASHRDSNSTLSAHISTPRAKAFIDAEGEAQIMRAGDSFQSDDGTLNFYSYIDWPYGGCPCSEKFGVKLGRWQLLPVVDVASNAIIAWDVISRPRGSYRAEDVAALLGRTMIEIGKPLWWALERGSWESNRVTDLLALSGVRRKTCWESKQKAAVEGGFNRLWTPMSLIPGHVGRDRSRMDKIEKIAQACQQGRVDPREHFLPMDQAMPHIDRAVELVNQMPMRSDRWGAWVPMERWTRQIAERPMTTLDARHSVFFAREIREWKVQKLGIGGRVDGPLLGFPVHFQHENFWEFGGCQVKAYFDPYAEAVTATVVLEDESWRQYKRGHVIARDVPMSPIGGVPMDILAESGMEWQGKDACNRLLAIRAAAAKAVRTERRNYLGVKSSTSLLPYTPPKTPVLTEGNEGNEDRTGTSQKNKVRNISGSDVSAPIFLTDPPSLPSLPSVENSASASRKRDRRAREAEIARGLLEMV